MDAIGISERKGIKTSGSLKREKLIGYSLIFPALLVIIFVMIVPLVFGLVMSMFQYKMGKEGFSNFIFLDSYIRFFNDGVALNSVKVTVLFSIGAIVGELALGILAAVLLLRINERFGAVLRGIFAMPLLISPIIIGLIWRYMYDPTYGLIYYFLGLVKLDASFGGLGSTSWALFCIIIADIWQNTPFILLVVTSGLVSIPGELYESGWIDGAGAFKQFYHITLPLLRKIIAVILLIRGGDAFRIFDIIYALTEGGPANSTQSLSIFAFKEGFGNYDMGYGMAASIITMVIMILFLGPLLNLTSKENT